MKTILISNLPTIIIMAALFIYVLYLAVNRKWEELRRSAYEGMIIAENVIVGTKKGQERFEAVFQKVYNLVPPWLQLFFPELTVKKKLQEWYVYIKDYFDDGVVGGKSLEQYFRTNNKAIDHVLRVNLTDNEVSFYIHPNGVDGDTLDYIVKGNLLKLKQ